MILLTLQKITKISLILQIMVKSESKINMTPKTEPTPPILPLDPPFQSIPSSPPIQESEGYPVRLAIIGTLTGLGIVSSDILNLLNHQTSLLVTKLIIYLSTNTVN